MIDGSDILKVSGNKLWYEHRNYQLPGTWVDHDDASGNEPTFVNGQAWYPEWDGGTSRPYTATAPLLPEHTVVKVTAVTVRGRGKVNVIEQPTEQNDYTLGVLLDDDPQDGAQWYEIHLRWQ